MNSRRPAIVQVVAEAALAPLILGKRKAAPARCTSQHAKYIKIRGMFARRAAPQILDEYLQVLRGRRDQTGCGVRAVVAKTRAYTQQE